MHAGIPPPPPGADTRSRPPPRADPLPPEADPLLAQSMLRDTVNALAVSILLECNLVVIVLSFNTTSDWYRISQNSLFFMER